MKKAIVCFVLSVLLSGCFAPEPVDYYSKVVDACEYLVPGKWPSAIPSVNNATSLTAECRDAMEAILPFDNSFEASEPAFKDKVMETFQFMISAPLEFPIENRFFLRSPHSIPLSMICIMAGDAYPEECLREGPANPDPNYNKNIFNYVMNRFDTIRYQNYEGISYIAYYDFHNNLENGRLSLTPYFWSPSEDASILNPTPIRATYFIHEARHGDGIPHTKCYNDFDGGKYVCDENLTGAYGLESVYRLMLLEGSVGVKTNYQYILNLNDIKRLGVQMCYVMKYRIHILPDELQALWNGVEDCDSVSWQWVLDNMGLSQ